MRDQGTFAAYRQRVNAQRREQAAEKRRVLGEEGWKALQKRRYEKRVEAIRRQNWSWLNEALERPFPLPWWPLDLPQSVPEEDTVQTLRAEALQNMQVYL